MDRVSKTTRSKIMAAVHARDTGAEKAVRSIVYHLGFRYSSTRNDLSGKPDLTLVGRRKVIFFLVWAFMSLRKFAHKPDWTTGNRRLPSTRPVIAGRQTS
jgi:DNA mismatch endonuclease Vsr